MTRPLVRSLTGQEIDDYHRKGWVLARDYVDPDHVAAMLDAAHRLMGVDDTTPTRVAPGAPPTGNQPEKTWWQNVNNASRQDEAFRRVTLNPQTGANIAALLRRPVGVRFWIDNLACKLPVGWGGSDGSTTFHQDKAHFPLDRSGTATCWIALDHVAANQGAMRFYEGSHRDEIFGDPSFAGSDDEILATFPWIRDYPLSHPIDLAAGDATFHHSQVVHGAPANTADRPRWNLATAYVAADALFNGAFCLETNDLGMEVNKPLDHPNFPLIWDPSDNPEAI